MFDQKATKFQGMCQQVLRIIDYHLKGCMEGGF